MMFKIRSARLISLVAALACCILDQASCSPPVRPTFGSIDLYAEPNGQSNSEDELSCGYKSCPPIEANKINVHVIAHTHDDVGWLKTVDQYFYGTNKRNSLAGVEFILDSVVPQLMMDPSKRFIYVEMSFFYKWWHEQSESMKRIVRRLVDEGRLEFINGGWCMNDEATVNYHSTIEQMTLGLKFLNETFGACGHPKVGWQIDPFGHTNEQASLFAQFGFDGMFFTRISYSDKRLRTKGKSLDLIWHGDRALSGQSGSIFTNIFRDGYDAPSGFCFDASCLDDLIVDNKNSYEYNVESKGNYMINFIRNYAADKLTSHVLIPFGGDFQFGAAGQNFKSLDKLLAYVNRNATDINMFYSTPSCYQFAVHKSVNEERIKLPEKYDDFMPYDSSYSVWWSGYFTSRPSVKLIERQIADLLQVARLVSLSDLIRLNGPESNVRSPTWIDLIKQHESKCLLPLWQILGDLQHHDAVTGTEKQHVADDYVRRAADAMRLCANFIGDIRRNKLNEMLKRSPKYDQLRAETAKLKFKVEPIYLEGTMFCPLLNISQCDALESEVDAQRFKLINDSSIRPFSDSAPKVDSGIGAAQLKQRVDEKYPKDLKTRAVLVTAYNPLARPINLVDLRLPCNGNCDLKKVQVIHLATNESMKLIRLSVPAGIVSLPFRAARTEYEMLFYANIPALGSTSFLISDENQDETIDDEQRVSESSSSNDERQAQPAKVEVRNRRIRRVIHDVEESNSNNNNRYEYFTMMAPEESEFGAGATRRRARDLSQSDADRVIVKFDMNAGVIVGLKRASDGSSLDITQKFGYYFPADVGEQPGAYIFRPNSSTPHLIDKPINFRMYKRQNGALIEIHQKWADWIWQTVRVDAKKNYIEFDYLVGPIPISWAKGREVITRYITGMPNQGIFFTDSNGRQLLPRRKYASDDPNELGGSFYPVGSTMMIRNNKLQRPEKSAEAVAVLVDRPQAGTSLNEGDLEFLIHRRLLRDDGFGVGEALNEPGEDGRGLVVRGRHRLFLKFQDNIQDPSQRSGGLRKPKPKIIKLNRTPRSNLTHADYEQEHLRHLKTQTSSDTTYLVYDQLLNDLKLESVKYSLEPVLTFDRLRVTANEYLELLASDSNYRTKTDMTLLNTTLPTNIHLVTLQPWDSRTNTLLIRLENLDNPITLHPHPHYQTYSTLVQSYRQLGNQYDQDEEDPCNDIRNPRVEVNIEYLIKRLRIVNLVELNLGANEKLKDDKRLDWTGEKFDAGQCDTSVKPSSIKLTPRQIRTFLASFQYV